MNANGNFIGSKTAGNDSKIYGLRFDGFNDRLNIDTPQTVTWLEMDFSNVDFDNTGDLQGFFGFENGFVRLQDSNSIRWRLNDTNENFNFSSFPKYPINEITTVRFELLNNNATIKIGDASASEDTTATEMILNAFCVNSAANDQFLKGEVSEIRLSNGLIYNDSNNWVGLTNLGATRVSTIDNGATWVEV